MSVRIRPGDGAARPVPPLDEDDLDRPASRQHIRSVFAADPADPADVDESEPRAALFERPRRQGNWLSGLNGHRPSWSRLVAVLVLAAVAVLLLGGLATRLSMPSPSAQPATAQTPTPPLMASATPTASDPPASDTQMTATSWQGAALPISPVAGPRVFTETRAYGFAHDPLGAALAAVHISTHLDPYTGPQVFGPAIDEQIVAAPDDLLATTTAAYEAAARAQGYPDKAIEAGRPVLAPTGSIRSWRIRDFRPERATVQLLVAAPNGQDVVYEVPVQWGSGDWAVSLADAKPGATFTTVRPGSTKDFNPFIDRGN